MTGDNIARLLYLVLLACAIGGWFIAQNRQSRGKIAQQAVVWGLIFLGVIAGVGLWGDIRQDVSPRQSYIANTGVIEVPRSANGHFYLTLEISGTPVRFIVDTGATQVVLSQKDAQRIGLNPETLAYVGSANTANGVVRTARVKLQNVTLGDISDQRITAYVNQGEMDESLLGMTYLQRFTKIEIAQNILRLTR